VERDEDEQHMEEVYLFLSLAYAACKAYSEHLLYPMDKKLQKSQFGNALTVEETSDEETAKTVTGQKRKKVRLTRSKKRAIQGEHFLSPTISTSGPRCTQLCATQP
jgi:hypothetical protein